MREASIVRSVIDIAESEARKHGGLNIRKIKLKVDEFRGVVKEALEFSFARSRKTRRLDLEIANSIRLAEASRPFAPGNDE